MMTAAEFWTARMAVVRPEWRAEAEAIMRQAETRRARADFNTGSISLTAALALRALCAWAQPVTIVEVGTFIGVSTLSLRADQIYTCDVSNDCLPSTPRIRTFPFQTSTQMLDQLPRRPVDLWFFDGLLTKADPKRIARLSTPATVYAFDDYNGNFKGMVNVSQLHPQLPGHVLFPAAGPIADDTTLAVLVPEARL